jgi:hypothetical protein
MTTTRTFAAWIAPLAEQTRESCRQVIQFARSAPTEFWERPAGNEGWTNKDLLAHIGRGNDQIVQQVLRSVTAGDPVDTAIFAIDNDEANAEAVGSRSESSVADLIRELEESGDEMLELLSRLTDEHEHYTQEDPPFALAGFLALVQRENHDIEHLEQLRASLEGDR